MEEETTIKPKDWFKRYDDPVTAQIDDAELTEAKQPANNHPAPVTPPNPTALRVAGIRHGGSAPIERVAPSQVQPRVAGFVAMDMGKGKYGLQEGVSPDVGTDGKLTGTVGGRKIVRFDDLPSTQIMRAASGRATDFMGAAQRNKEMWTKQAESALANVQFRARAAREASEKRRVVEEGDAKRNLADAYTLAVSAWRDAKPMDGKNADGTPSGNKYKVGILEPATVRDLNSKIAPIIGMRKGDKIVGMYAVAPTDANGDSTGMPSIIVRWRAPNGTMKKNVISYKDAAQYVRDSLGDRSDKNADWNFVQQYGTTWYDPNDKAYDVLGLKKTGHVMDQEAKMQATDLKNDLTRQQMEQGKTEFEQKQQALAEKKENEPVAALEKERNDLYGLFQKTADPAMRDKIASRIMEIGDSINSERGRIEFRKKFNAAKDGDEVTPGRLKRGNEIVAAPGYEEFTDKKTKEKGFRVMKGVATGADGKPKYDDNGKLVLERGWVLGEDGVPVKQKKPGAKPKAAQGGASATPTQPAAPANANAESGELDYDTREGQSAMQKDVEAGGGEYSTNDDGYLHIRIGNWDYLSKADKKAMPELHDQSRNRRIDVKAIHAMQKKANEAFAEFNRKRKAEEDSFRKSLKGQGLTQTAIDGEVATHMATWDNENDPAKIRAATHRKRTEETSNTTRLRMGGL